MRSCSIAEESVHVLVLGDHLLAEKPKEQLQLLHFVGDGPRAPVDGRAEDEHCDSEGHQRTIEVIVILRIKDLEHSIHHVIRSVEEFRNGVVVEGGALHLLDPLLEGRVETFVVGGQDRVHEGAGFAGRLGEQVVELGH